MAHDLRAPLRHVDGFSKILLEDYGTEMQEEARRLLERVRDGAQRMGTLIDELLHFSRLGRRELQREITGLNSLVDEARAGLRTEADGRAIEWRIGRLPFADCDPALKAPNGAAALATAAAHDGPIDLLITDIVMPGMRGQELAAKLSAVRPLMRILYVSGYTDGSFQENGELEGGAAFLEKPFSRDALARKVREVLNGARPAGEPPSEGAPFAGRHGTGAL